MKYSMKEKEYDTNSETQKEYCAKTDRTGQTKEFKNANKLIEDPGARIIYKGEEAPHFISGLSHTTGNDLDASSDGIILQSPEKKQPKNRRGRSCRTTGSC